MYNVAVLTISDRCSQGLTKDISGPRIKEIISNLPAEVMQYDIVPDEPPLIKQKLIAYCDDLKVHLVLTTGGTGLTTRDHTPEVTRDILDREIPGISERMRLEGFKSTPNAMLSRGIAGLRDKTLIINLPGSPKGAQESLQAIMPGLAHGLDMVLEKEH